MFSNPNRQRVYAPSGGPMMTKQSMKNECDINQILSQFKKTGIITHIQSQQPTYTDLPDNTDYQSAMNTILRADSAFASLPSVVRRYFNNDPNALLAAMSDPDMHDKLVELGIYKPAEDPQPPGNPANNPPTNPTVPTGGSPQLP